MELSRTDGDIHACLTKILIPPADPAILRALRFITSSPSVNIKREIHCIQCLDWWSQGVTKPKIYTIQQESFLYEINNFPVDELSFEMIYNSIISLQDLSFSSNSSNAEIEKVIKIPTSNWVFISINSTII
jgi:hypothetical protein